MHLDTGTAKRKRIINERVSAVSDILYAEPDTKSLQVSGIGIKSGLPVIAGAPLLADYIAPIDAEELKKMEGYFSIRPVETLLNVCTYKGDIMALQSYRRLRSDATPEIIEDVWLNDEVRM